MLTPPRALQSAPLPPANQRVLVPSHPAATTAPATLSALNTEAVRCRSIMMITIKTSIVIPRECISFLSELCPFMLFPPFPLFSSLTYYYLYVTSRRITPITTETIIWLRWHFVFCSSLFFTTFLSFLPIYEQSALQGKLFLFLGMNSDVNNLKYKELGRSCNWSISMDRFPGSYLFIFFFSGNFVHFNQKFWSDILFSDTMGMDWSSSIGSILVNLNDQTIKHASPEACFKGLTFISLSVILKLKCVFYFQ